MTTPAHSCAGLWHRDERVAACPACARAILAVDLRPGDRVAPLHGAGRHAYEIVGAPRLAASGAVVAVAGSADGSHVADLIFAASAELEPLDINPLAAR